MINTCSNVKTNSNIFIKADEVSETMDISTAYAYKIIKKLNNELIQKGFLVVNGRTSRKYFYERLYGDEC